jgi:hypothetical protein
VEVDPAVSGRWGPSVVLLPAGETAAALHALAEDALAIAGAGHWASGTAGAAHVTLRALGHWGGDVHERHVTALERAFVEPVTLDFTGTRLLEATVLAMAVDVGGAGDRLRARYGEELGDDGWLERKVLPRGRDIWYLTLVHFATPDVDRDALALWVDDKPIGRAVFDAAHVCRWGFDGRRMVPEPLATVRCR